MGDGDSCNSVNNKNKVKKIKRPKKKKINCPSIQLLKSTKISKTEEFG